MLGMLELLVALGLILIVLISRLSPTACLRAESWRFETAFRGCSKDLTTIGTLISAILIVNGGCDNGNTPPHIQDSSSSSVQSGQESSKDPDKDLPVQQTKPENQTQTKSNSEHSTSGDSQALNITGLWRLVKIEGENGPGKEGGSDSPDILIEEGENGYAWSLAQKPSNNNSGLPFTIQRHGEHYLIEMTIKGEVWMRGLADIANDQFRFIFDFAALDQMPKDFRLTNNKTKLIITFERHLPATFTISGPEGVRVSVGSWQDTIAGGRDIKVKTWPLPPRQITLINVVASTTVDGLEIRDRCQVWSEAGGEHKIDFSDMLAPNVAQRTQRYWDRCLRLFRSPLPPELGEGSPNKPQGRILRFASHVHDTPTLGVDPVAVATWQEFANIAERVTAERTNDTGLRIFMDSFTSAARGDVFGSMIDRLNTEDHRQASLHESLVNLKTAATILTSKYGTEFSCP